MSALYLLDGSIREGQCDINLGAELHAPEVKHLSNESNCKAHWGCKGRLIGERVQRHGVQ